MCRQFILNMENLTWSLKRILRPGGVRDEVVFRGQAKAKWRLEIPYHAQGFQQGRGTY